MINHPPNDTTLLWYIDEKTSIDRFNDSIIDFARKYNTSACLVYMAIARLHHSPNMMGLLIVEHTFLQKVREAIMERMATLKASNANNYFAYQAAVKPLSIPSLQHFTQGIYDEEMPDLLKHFNPKKKNTELQVEIWQELNYDLQNLKRNFAGKNLVKIIYENCQDEIKEFARIARITQPWHPMN